MDDDHTLLSRFAKSRDERAFAELVRRHLDLVYGVCLRRTGSRPLAEELVQNVFAALSRKAGSLKPEVLVVGWLHRAAHLESSSAFRTESTRLRKMKNYMDQPSDCDPEPDRFHEISPFLDQALDALPASDRDVILLRFASNLTLQQIGNQLGKSESAAQRHLQRVLEKLAGILRRRGVTTTAAALTLFLGADFAKAAPASLTVAFVCKTAIGSAAVGGFTLIKFITLLSIMKNKAIIIAAVCLLAAGGSAVYISNRSSASSSASSAASAVAKDLATSSGVAAAKDPVTAMSQELATNSSSRRPRPVSEYPELDEKFGVSQVRLAKSATDGWLKFAVSTNHMNELFTALEGKSGEEDKEETADPLSSVPGLTLTAEQKAKVKAALAKRNAAERAASLVIQARFTKNRTDVMELLLASDAANHGKMSIADYQVVLDGKKELLLAMAGLRPNDDSIQHPFYRSELPSILDQDQLALFEKFLSEQAPATASQPAVGKSYGLYIKKISDGPNKDAPTLEKIDAGLRKINSATDAGLKMAEAIADLIPKDSK